MKNKVEVDTYRFVGDSKVNEAQNISNGQLCGSYTQTEIIKVLNDNRDFVCGGSHPETGNSPRDIFLIYFGKDKKNPDQLIKIIMDSENITNGDPNALAIQGMCNHAIKVKYKNIRHKVIATTAGALATIGLMGTLVGGMIWADKKETEYQQEKNSSYQEWLEEERRQNGIHPSDIVVSEEDSPVIYEDDLNRSR